MTISCLVLRLVIMVAMSTSLCACQTMSGQARLSSVVATEMSEELAVSLAADAASQLAGFISVSGPLIELDSKADAFGSALEQALRQKGYGLVSTQDRRDHASSVQLAYVIDRTDDRLLLRVSTGAIDLTRLYSVNGDIAVPSSPVSVMHHGDASGD